jgi:hypothetical protein
MEGQRRHPKKRRKTVAEEGAGVDNKQLASLRPRPVP